jgi:hypothetical protein
MSNRFVIFNHAYRWRWRDDIILYLLHCLVYLRAYMHSFMSHTHACPVLMATLAPPFARLRVLRLWTLMERQLALFCSCADPLTAVLPLSRMSMPTEAPTASNQAGGNYRRNLQRRITLTWRSSAPEHHYDLT